MKTSKILIFTLLCFASCTIYGPKIYKPESKAVVTLPGWEITVLGISDGGAVDGTFWGDRFLYLHTKVKNTSDQYAVFRFGSYKKTLRYKQGSGFIELGKENGYTPEIDRLLEISPEKVNTESYHKDYPKWYLRLRIDGGRYLGWPKFIEESKKARESLKPREISDNYLFALDLSSGDSTCDDRTMWLKPGESAKCTSKYAIPSETTPVGIDYFDVPYIPLKDTVETGSH